MAAHPVLEKAVAAELKSRPGTVHVVSRSTGLDITDEAAIIKYFESVGPIDHVVITAGSSAPGGAVNDVSIDAAKEAFNTKFWGSVAVAKHAAAHMRSDGSITLTSGFLARRTVPGTFVKTAMNAALEATAKLMAKDWAPIRVNVISPGLTDTEAYSGMPEATRSTMLANAAATLPAGKVGTATELASGYLFAIDNAFVTGSVIDIDDRPCNERVVDCEEIATGKLGCRTHFAGRQSGYGNRACQWLSLRNRQRVRYRVCHRYRWRSTDQLNPSRNRRLPCPHQHACPFKSGY